MAIIVNDTTPRNQYTASAGQTAFTYAFEIFEVTDIKVYNGTSVLTYASSPANGAQYSVSNAGVTGGGVVTLGSGGASNGNIITIIRDIPVKRTTDFPSSGPFNIDSLNTDLDKIIAIIREREDEINRSLQLSDTDSTTTMTLPITTTRASKLLGFDSSGNATVVAKPSSSAITINTGAAGSSASGSVSYTDSTGAIAIVLTIPRGNTGVTGDTGSTGASTKWTTGISFPSSSLNDGDLHMFTANVGSGLTWKDTNGSTSLTAASIGDIAQYQSSGTKWVKQNNIFGAQGNTGATGPVGSAGISLLWETQTGDSDQGAGKIWGNNSTFSSISGLYIDDVDKNGANIETWIQTLDDSTNTALRGTIYIEKEGSNANFGVFSVTGACVDKTGYWFVPVSHVSSAVASLADGDSVNTLFSRTGNAGTDGTDGDGVGNMNNIVDDQPPQLGGNLDINGKDIITTSNANIDLAPHGTGKVVVKGNTNAGTIIFNCESNSHGQTVKSQPHSATVTNTLTLPAGGDGELVSTVATQTLTNKSIVATQLTGAVPVNKGGTNLTSFTAGDLLYATGTTTLAKLAKGTAAQVLAMNSGASAPVWADASSGGGVEWQSSIVTASTLTAVAGRAYWINTTSNACTITLPSSASVGDELIFTDYLRTWSTNAVTINQNSLKFQSLTTPNPVYSVLGLSVSIVYSGSATGWIPNRDGAVGNKTQYSPEILVIGGGGAGGRTSTGYAGGGGGSGGISYHSNYTAMTTGVSYAVVVGAGAAQVTSNSQMSSNVAPSGANSTFGSGSQTIMTAYGGGGGAGHQGTYTVGGAGGSGGGSEATDSMGATGANATKGTGGTKHYGNRGGTPGTGASLWQARGGGGAGASPGANYNGGSGTADFHEWGDATSTGHNSAGTRYYASGGNGGIGQSGGTAATTIPNGGGGIGGDGGGGSGGDGIDGTGSGGGGRGKWNAGSGNGGAGGNGIVIIRRLTSSSTTSSGAVSTSGIYTYHVFTSNGTYTS